MHFDFLQKHISGFLESKMIVRLSYCFDGFGKWFRQFSIVCSIVAVYAGAFRATEFLTKSEKFHSSHTLFEKQTQYLWTHLDLLQAHLPSFAADLLDIFLLFRWSPSNIDLKSSFRSFSRPSEQIDFATVVKCSWFIWNLWFPKVGVLTITVSMQEYSISTVYMKKGFGSVWINQIKAFTGSMNRVD